MKVLSLREPFATLIKNGIKTIETRSWRTNYRGTLYIHASASKITKEDMKRTDLMALTNLDDLNYGNIICSCQLVDCIEMTDDFIEEVKKNKPKDYVSGFYEVGRYAWILKDVKPLTKPIAAKGQLGIWNFNK